MKYFLGSSALFIVIALSVMQGGMTSCTKDHTIFDTVTVVKKDTVYIQDTVLTAAILTAHPWKTQELRALYGVDVLYYMRGGSSNTFNFDTEYFTFNPGGTGVSIDANGFTHEIKEWQLSNTTNPINTNNTKLTFKYRYSTSSSIFHDMTWENIRYKNKSLMTDEYWHDNFNGKDYHGQAIRIPK